MMMSMKCSVLVCCLAVAVLADEKYTDKYDNIDIKEILENKRLLTSYVHCMLDKGKCNAEGKELKEHLQDALETGCSKCTDRQKEGSTTIIDWLIAHEREFWDELCAKYDPEGIWRKKYENEAKEKGIIIPEH